ncbi:unnamed protein product [Durusdinium trenchii]|uniref:ABC transporter domain-containing protein n=1 Tax=Durusdinium trenchii TaxID=1381693 RepID=A0ABP0PUN2_9DINO
MFSFQDLHPFRPPLFSETWAFRSPASPAHHAGLCCDPLGSPCGQIFGAGECRSTLDLWSEMLRSTVGLVLAYVFGFMVLVSAHEAAARPKVTYPGIFYKSVLSLGSALLLSGLLLLFIVQPDPWYDAQYVIPLAGMLINNSLSGVALALNAMIDHLHNNKEQVEVLLAFGATPWEAAWPGFVKSVQAALIPAINGMNVVGLVSIPGMMTGQILGGAPPMKAARYQIVITFLISGCSFAALCLICAFTIQAFFDERGRHDDSEVKPQSRLNISKLLDFSKWPSRKTQAVPATSTPLLADSASPLALQKTWDKSKDGGGLILDLPLEGLVGKQRPLKVHFKVHDGEVLCMMGPSGAGKSTILKWIADLSASVWGSRTLRGQEISSPQHWRREVLYLHQIKAPLPGTPKSFAQVVSKLWVNAQRNALPLPPLLQSIGLDESLLERPWSELSGGESQRMMFAIAMATEPACLVLDEPTSALDEASKRLVEEVLQKRGKDSCIILATHDPKQAERVGSALWSFSVGP